MSFSNMSTSMKLMVSFGALLICIMAMLLTAFKSFGELRDNSFTLESPIHRALDVARLASLFDELQLAVIAGNNISNRDAQAADINEKLAKAQGLIDAINKAKQQDVVTGDLNQSFQTIRQSIQQNYLPSLKSKNALNTSSYLQGPEASAFTRLRQTCTKELAKTESDLNQQNSSTAKTTNDSLFIFGFIGCLSLALGLLLSFMLNNVIAEPMLQITTASERLATGDLNVTLPNPERRDEVGALVRAFAEVVGSLDSMSKAAQQVALGDLTVVITPRSEQDSLGSAFKSMLENMALATSQIKNAVSVLSSAVNNIMASVAESATGATQTATAVTETTTTVEEVRQTSNVANQKAKHVAESAQKSAQISTMGRKSTEETIQGMKRIREQMDLIADSMVRLSEKSQSIVEIIATVDDLAQQSNLLAVNASIEAAKAGELGRGFAVVAQEVKSMADQSKQATAQVRKILTEIQQATSSAAMATELGSRAVDAAVTQSNQAGEAISVLANSVMESANAAAQIAVSSQQQLAGVDQVATAMLGIKDATAQNLIAIRHVEDSAQSLHELGGMLKVILQRYKL